MSIPYQQFKKNLESLKVIDSLYLYFSSQVQAMDLSEILRSQFVLIISAFDCYVHDVVRYEMMDIFIHNKDKSKSFEEFQIPLKYILQIISLDNIDTKKEILNNAIKKVTSKDSYQSPSSIEFALNLISIKNIWTKISSDIGMSSEDIKLKLGLVVNRRNKIAHEADIDIITGEKNMIERSDIIETFDFIEKIVTSLDKICHPNLYP